MKVAVLGAGAWGTALAMHVVSRHRTVLWSRNPAVLKAVRDHGINDCYLPDVALPAALQVTDDLAGAAAQADLVVMATSVAGIRPVSAALAGVLSPGTCPGIVCLSKGLEATTRLFPHQVLEAALPGLRVGCLSGPSFAQEVAAGLPVALTAASLDEALPHQMVEAFHHGPMRVYRSADLVGVEVAGALKNIMAVATGICDGLGLGLNARSALLTRGLAEITRFGLAHGASAETFLGLAGVGDLVLTCTGDLSRNRRVGLLLAKGQSLPAILTSLGHVAEGVACCPAVVSRAEEAGIEMPISQAVLAVIEGRLAAREAVGKLLARSPRQE
ncbi:MAG: NAD(P)H-dependent glycerol-3-phosphate dehydrogenase [Lautropia sp.]|nr:NAD(P)H-dependent glycerol-3-phosphate dehydrogenase [Lautropia sp.]